MKTHYLGTIVLYILLLASGSLCSYAQTCPVGDYNLSTSNPVSTDLSASNPIVTDGGSPYPKQYVIVQENDTVGFTINPTVGGSAITGQTVTLFFGPAGCSPTTATGAGPISVTLGRSHGRFWQPFPSSTLLVVLHPQDRRSTQAMPVPFKLFRCKFSPAIKHKSPGKE